MGPSAGQVRPTRLKNVFGAEFYVGDLEAQSPLFEPQSTTRVM